MESDFGFDVIISHGPGCADGATSAWCFWRKLSDKYKDKLSSYGGVFSKSLEDEFEQKDGWINPTSVRGALKMQKEGMPVVFVFAQPSYKFPKELVQDKRVLILDLDVGKELVYILESAKSVMLVDHHDTTPKTLSKYRTELEKYENKLSQSINTEKSDSGASLSWKLAFPNTELPPFIQVVRIDDTWSWEDCPELNAKQVITTLKFNRQFRTFNHIEQIFLNWDANFSDWSKKGNDIIEVETANAEWMAKACDLGYIKTNDGKVYTVAYALAPILISETGSLMKKFAEKRFKRKIDFCVTWKYLSYKNLVLCSARSPAENLNLGLIVSDIQGNGERGGGHAEAAGFNFDGLENFHKFIMKTDPREVVDAEENTIPKSNFFRNLFLIASVSSAVVAAYYLTKRTV